MFDKRVIFAVLLISGLLLSYLVDTFWGEYMDIVTSICFYSSIICTFLITKKEEVKK
jgi:hypothetical protein